MKSGAQLGELLCRFWLDAKTGRFPFYVELRNHCCELKRRSQPCLLSGTAQHFMLRRLPNCKRFTKDRITLTSARCILHCNRFNFTNILFILPHQKNSIYTVFIRETMTLKQNLVSKLESLLLIMFSFWPMHAYVLLSVLEFVFGCVLLLCTVS